MFKRLILAFICVGAIASPSAMAQQVPFANGQSQARTEFQTQKAVELIEKQRSGGQGARDAADALWESMMSPSGAYYPAMIEGLQFITGTGFAGWAMVFLWNWRKGKEANVLAMFQPLMVILMFQNNGALMSATVNGGRYILESLNNFIFDASLDGVTGREAFIRSQNMNAYLQTRDKEIQQCSKEVDPEVFATCKNQAEETAKEYLKELTGGENLLEGLSLAIEGTVLDLGVSNQLYFVSGVYFLVLEYLLAFWGLLAPLFIASHLLPKGQLGIKMMSAGFIGILTATLSYTVLSGACAVFLASAFAGNPTVYAALIGIVNPFLSLGIGAMGISAGLSGTGQALSFTSRMFRRIA